MTVPTDPGPPPPGVVRLTVRGHGPFVPTVQVNGRLVTVRWGAQDLVVPPGPTVVEAPVTAAVDHGHARLQVDVPPGAVVPVFYAPPWSRFMRGSMGTEPQRMPGRWVVAPAALVVLAVPLLVALSFIVR